MQTWLYIAQPISSFANTALPMTHCCHVSPRYFVIIMHQFARWHDTVDISCSVTFIIPKYLDDMLLKLGETLGCNKLECSED